MNNEKPIEEMSLTELMQKGYKHMGENDSLAELILAQRMIITQSFGHKEITPLFYDETLPVIIEGFLASSYLSDQVKKITQSSENFSQEIERVSERFGQIQKEIMLRSLKKITSI